MSLTPSWPGERLRWDWVAWALLPGQGAEEGRQAGRIRCIPRRLPHALSPRSTYHYICGDIFAPVYAT